MVKQITESANAQESDSPSRRAGWGLAEQIIAVLARHLWLHPGKLDGDQNNHLELVHLSKSQISKFKSDVVLSQFRGSGFEIQRHSELERICTLHVGWGETPRELPKTRPLGVAAVVISVP